MTTNAYRTAQLGDLVSAVFDEAAHYTSDPKAISRLATRVLSRILRRARKSRRGR